MSEAPRSSHKTLFIVLLLLCAGAGAWFYTQQTGQTPWDAILAPKADKYASEEAVVEKPAAEKVVEVKRIQEEVMAHQVSSALSSEPRPVEAAPEEALNARLDKALSGGEDMKGGDSVGGSIASEPASAVAEEVREDAVVTRGFVRDLAFWMVSNYTPSSYEGREGRTEMTLRKTNARYSSSQDLRSTERDALKARTSILRYVFSPGMLEALYLMYSPEFLEELEKAAGQSRRTLNGKLKADVFKVYAAQMKRVSSALDAASQLDIADLVRPMRRAAATEESASEDFARAYNAHSEARDAGQADIMAEQSDRMVQSARLASEFDAKKEQAGRVVVRTLRQKAQGVTLDDDDLLFLAEWLDRREASPEATAAAARVCRRMAEDMARRAGELAAPAMATVQ